LKFELKIRDRAQTRITAPAFFCLANSTSILELSNRTLSILPPLSQQIEAFLYEKSGFFSLMSHSHNDFIDSFSRARSLQVTLVTDQSADKLRVASAEFARNLK